MPHLFSYLLLFCYLINVVLLCPFLRCSLRSWRSGRIGSLGGTSRRNTATPTAIPPTRRQAACWTTSRDCLTFQTSPKPPPRSAPLRRGTCLWLDATMVWRTVRRETSAPPRCTRGAVSNCTVVEDLGLTDRLQCYEGQTENVESNLWKALERRTWEGKLEGPELSISSDILPCVAVKSWADRVICLCPEISVTGRLSSTQPPPQPENKYGRHPRCDV